MNAFKDFLRNYENKVIAEAAMKMYNAVFEGVASDVNPHQFIAGIPEPAGLDGTVNTNEYFDDKSKEDVFGQSHLTKELIGQHEQYKKGAAPQMAQQPQRTTLGIMGTASPQNTCADTSTASA